MAANAFIPTSFAFSFPPTTKLDKLDGTNWQIWNSTLTALMCMNGCRRHLTHAGPAHADPANPDANVTALWDKQEEVIIVLFALYTTSEVYNQVTSDVVYPMVVKISPRMSQKQLRFGDDVGKRKFIKFAKKYHQQQEECASVGRIVVRVTCATHASPTWTRSRCGNEDEQALLLRPEPSQEVGSFGGRQNIW